MKTILLLILLLITFFSKISACYAEWEYCLFPIGEIENKVVFIEFDFHRNCKEGKGVEQENEFWFVGTINLVNAKLDSTFLIQNIDSIDLRECVCSYEDFYERSEFESLLDKYYQKGIEIAKINSNFELAKSKRIVYNDTIHTELIEEINDTTYNMLYQLRIWMSVKI